MGRRINQVRYYRFGDLKGALRKVVENPEDRKEVLILMSMTKP